MKTEPSVKETTSQSDPQLEASAATSSAEHQQPEPPEPSLKKGRGCDGFKQASRNLEVLLESQRTKEEFT